MTQPTKDAKLSEELLFQLESALGSASALRHRIAEFADRMTGPRRVGKPNDAGARPPSESVMMSLFGAVEALLVTLQLAHEDMERIENI